MGSLGFNYFAESANLDLIMPDVTKCLNFILAYGTSSPSGLVQNCGGSYSIELFFSCVVRRKWEHSPVECLPFPLLVKKKKESQSRNWRYERLFFTTTHLNSMI